MSENETALTEQTHQDQQVFVVAENTGEMQQAQSRLVAFIAHKMTLIQAEIRELDKEARIAQEHKWRVSGLRAAVGRAKQRLVFYSKVRQALSEGYCIIPDLPIELFAIRINRDDPAAKRGESYYQSTGVEPSQKLPIGAGRYLSPKTVGFTETEKSRDSQGRETTHKMFTPTDFADVEFPVAACEPRIMNATARAMALKLFDELGIVRHGRQDPLIVGRILNPKSQYSRPICFVICWFVNLREL